MLKFKSYWRNRFLGVSLLILLPIIFTACYYDYGMSVSDYDVVATFYDKDYSFATQKTFSIAPNIGHITEEGEVDTTKKTYDNYIIQQIRSNMQIRGYQEITDPTVTSPDFLIVCIATRRNNYVAYQSYPWWGYWGYYPGYGGYYPWYPPTTVYNYPSGSLIINLVDPKLVDENDKLIPAVWVAGINGLLDDDTVNIRTRLSSDISQAFEQSPYLLAPIE